MVLENSIKTAHAGELFPPYVYVDFALARERSLFQDRLLFLQDPSSYHKTRLLVPKFKRFIIFPHNLWDLFWSDQADVNQK